MKPAKFIVLSPEIFHHQISLCHLVQRVDALCDIGADSCNDHGA